MLNFGMDVGLGCPQQIIWREYEQWRDELQRLIPTVFHDGLPPFPDVARVYSTCDRADFFPPE